LPPAEPAGGATEGRRSVEKRKLGELLVDSGTISEHQLQIALAEHQRTGRRLGNTLIDLGLVTEEAISRVLASQTGVEHYVLDHTPIDPEAVRLVPESLARRRQLLPLRLEDEALVVAMANPTDIVAIDELERTADRFVSVGSASRRQILAAIDRVYGGQARRETALEEAIRRAAAELESGEAEAGGSAVVAVLDEILSAAIRRDATDVHFEPDEKVVRVRLRIDGDLVLAPTLPADLLQPLVARIKVLAGLDIAETRVPQDGKIRFPIERRRVDLRISTFPSVHGESVVARILDTGGAQMTLATVGLGPREQEQLAEAVKRPNGLILAAGPTGSGKTTTLYALLRAVDSSKRKVITLEDPVEYGLALVTQCQINEKAGLTFAAGLRSILRHDPDIVLVGEMRDAETATMALRAALTGHLVLSTIHTNDAVRTVSRLRDMGCESFLVGSCLSTVVAQRLVRLVCTKCREEYLPRPEDLVAVGLEPGEERSFVHATGCAHCNETGVRGREALFELLEVTPEIAQLISHGAPVDEIETAALAGGMIPFRHAAHAKAAEGRVSLEEVARITSEY
jgi:type IV pilus assembly protein PilB